MNIGHAVEDKQDQIIAKLKELKPEGRVDELQLTILLSQVYIGILPPVAKLFVSRAKFVNACLEKKEFFLSEINRESQRKKLTLIQ